MAKTRTLAQKLAESGHVRLNGTRVEASSQTVKSGDVLTIALEERIRILEVKGFSERRGSAVLASALYEDRSPPRPPREQAPPSGLTRDKGTGRPTKKDQRLISHVKGRD